MAQFQLTNANRPKMNIRLHWPTLFFARGNVRQRASLPIHHTSSPLTARQIHRLHHLHVEF
jgi:hypothetical protein